MSYLAILGRQPALSIAELESVFGAEAIQVISNQAVIISTENSVHYAQNLGGTIKISQIIDQTKSNNWQDISRSLSKSLPRLTAELDEGKITLGISCVNISISPQRLNASALELKKQLKNSGRSVRIVPNKELMLNSATVLHNKLTGGRGIEFIVVGTKNGSYIARNIYEQDIDSYAARDQARPMRDSKVGMLPPKLAQIIINLALNSASAGSKITVLDPFCGTGVILQEALLIGHDGYGSDLEQRMIDFSQKNLEWLGSNNKYTLEVGDATSHTWAKHFDTVACETYLGRPLQTLPDRQALQKIINDCDTIHKKFLQNLARQTPAGFKLCIAVPAWSLGNSFLHLKTLDSLEDLGYNRLRFVHTKTSDLIYHRKDQYVARELVVLERK